MGVHCIRTPKGLRLLEFHGIERLIGCEVTYRFLVQAVKSGFYRRHALLEWPRWRKGHGRGVLREARLTKLIRTATRLLRSAPWPVHPKT